ncbi:hypothetical protein MMC20_002495 [Loxospora ochrophaea]|nr:hypothetical protein [Loxospora ochrophaea]
MNLLGMQAELCSLQEELELNAKNNEKRGPEHRRLQCDWTSLDSGQPESEERKNLLMKVRSKLDEYNNTLIQQITLNKQAAPRPSDLNQLRAWLTNVFHGASALRGPGADVWFAQANGEIKREDFISIWPRKNASDSFTMLLFKLMDWWTSVLPNTPHFGLKKQTFPGRVPSWLPSSSQAQDFEIYSTVAVMVRFADTIATVMCCLIITVPIIILNYIHNSNFRLLVILLSTLLFSFLLASSSDAARKDIFAATAAFTAVQVVFVGNSQ